jgi:hypothetical protein
MNPFQITFALFSLVAAGGLLMTAMVVAKIRIPAGLGAGHGVAGLISLAVLLTVNLRSDATPALAWWALAVFSAGFAGGVLLFRVLFRGAAPLLLLVVAHGSAAVLGLYLLYGPAFRMS